MSCAVSSYQLSTLERAVQAHVSGDTQLAEALYRECLQQQPLHPKASQFLGVLLFQKGSRLEGLRLLESAVRATPNDSEAWSNLGNAYRVMAKGPEAIAALDQAIKLDPSNASAYCTLSACLRKEGTLGAAIDAARTASRLQPQLTQAHCNLGYGLLEAGEAQAAIASFQQALYLSPGCLEARQSLVFAMHYSDKCSAEGVLAEARRLSTSFPHRTLPVRNGPLRTVAFLSGDFRQHPVAFFLEPVLSELAQSGMKIVLLSNSHIHDAWTERLSLLADQTFNVTDLEASQIQALALTEDLDVVVDLAGHTASNRADAVGRRIAPVQISYLGYSGTTGLTNMDYVLVDPVVAGDNVASAFSEEVLLFSRSLFNFEPSRLPSWPTRVPCEQNGFVTFGSFNNLSKISPACLSAWVSVLRQVPGSRLVVKSLHLGEKRFADRLRQQLLLRGLTADRVEILGHTPGDAHFATVASVDIGLDTFPYTGATTTCELLAQGVPVVTLKGDRYAGRMSASILEAIGRPGWIAETVDDYVTQAVQLAGDPSGLASARHTLPASVSGSPLCDRDAHAADFRRLIETAWEQSRARNNP